MVRSETARRGVRAGVWGIWGGDCLFQLSFFSDGAEIFFGNRFSRLQIFLAKCKKQDAVSCRLQGYRRGVFPRGSSSLVYRLRTFEGS